MSSPLMRSQAPAWLLATVLLAVLVACSKLLAPSDATIEIKASSAVISANSSSSVVATVLDNSGTAVQDGTMVDFQATIGRMNPPHARTMSGAANTQFTSNQIGTATITATSGGVTSNSITIAVGEAVTVSLTATPTTAPVNSTVTFTATVSPSGTTIDHYEWTFGDTATATTSTGTTQHIYLTTGTKTVTVKAVTSGSAGPTTQIQVVVQ